MIKFFEYYIIKYIYILSYIYIFVYRIYINIFYIFKTKTSGNQIDWAKSQVPCISIYIHS